MGRIDTKTELQLANALEHLAGANRELAALTKSGFKAPINQADLELKLLKVKTIIKEAQLEIRRLLLAEKTYLNAQNPSRVYQPNRTKTMPVKKCAGCQKKTQ